MIEKMASLNNFLYIMRLKEMSCFLKKLIIIKQKNKKQEIEKDLDLTYQSIFSVKNYKLGNT